MKMLCAKSCLNWSRNVGGVAKIQFCGFRDFAKKNYGRKWAWPRPKDAADSSEYVGQVFDCGRFGVGVIAPNAYSLV